MSFPVKRSQKFPRNLPIWVKQDQILKIVNTIILYVLTKIRLIDTVLFILQI